MDGEIDLELYTLSIIKLNNTFEKLDNNEPISEIKTQLKECDKDLTMLYKEIVEDLNREEVNINEYYLFFSNGKMIFPQYIETLKNIKNDEIEEEISSLINVFTNLNEIAKPFSNGSIE